MSMHCEANADDDADSSSDIHVQPASPCIASDAAADELEHRDAHSPTNQHSAVDHDSERARSESDERDLEMHNGSGADECADEVAWLRACHFLDDSEDDDAAGNRDSGRYIPQLMDTREMRTLRATLRKSEYEVETCGRMREYVPRRPTVLPEHGRSSSKRGASLRDLADQVADVQCPDSSVDNRTERHDRGQQQSSSAIWTAGPTRAFLTAAPSTTALDAATTAAATAPSASHRTREDFALVLRRELRQLRELELRYDEMKRMLLEQMDVVCSLKPSERTGGPETYDKLAELLAFAAQWEHPPQQQNDHQHDKQSKR